MFFPVSEWIPAFLLTLVTEVPVAVYLLRGSSRPTLHLAILVVFANLATHPSVWFVFTQLFLVGTPEYVIAAEVWAMGVEAVFYAVTVGGIAPSRALIVAIVANLVSFVAGRLLLQPWLALAG